MTRCLSPCRLAARIARTLPRRRSCRHWRWWVTVWSSRRTTLNPEENSRRDSDVRPAFDIRERKIGDAASLPSACSQPLTAASQLYSYVHAADRSQQLVMISRLLCLTQRYHLITQDSPTASVLRLMCPAEECFH